jgi:hypothetical protein
MEPQLLKVLGQIAGIGGIALGVFLLLFRDVIRRKIFPKLTQNQGYRVILVFMILTWSIAIAGVAAWWKSPLPGPGDEKKILTATASIWKVDLDTKGALVGSKELSGTPGRGISAANLNELADWISSELGLAERKDAKKVRVKVLIPADLSSRKPLIQRIPDGPMEVLLWDLRGGGKSRLPIDWETVRQMKEEFQLEVRVPGSAATVINVIPGQALDKEIELEPDTVGIGVEKFTGSDDGVSERLCEQLRAKPLVKVVNPEMLETIRAKVERDNEAIRKNPGSQMRLRSLGVDYVISGNVRSESR